MGSRGSHWFIGSPGTSFWLLGASLNLRGPVIIQTLRFLFVSFDHLDEAVSVWHQHEAAHSHASYGCNVVVADMKSGFCLVRAYDGLRMMTWKGFVAVASALVMLQLLLLLLVILVAVVDEGDRQVPADSDPQRSANRRGRTGGRRRTRV